ncbi:MAG: glycosyltransferase family 4 protein [Actinomycetota bacterium]|nr:glycosyltransferase family 4 protein [Actinomycetota bacterium]
MRVGIVCPYDWSHPGGVRSHIVGLTGALQRRGVEVEVIAPASAEEEGIFAPGRTFGIPYNGSVARLCFTPRASARVKKRLESAAYDLLHVHEPGSPSVSMLAVMHARMPLVGTFHASSEKSLAYQLFRPALKPLMSRISERIAVSEASKRLISSYFPDDYHVIPNGIDYRRFAEARPDEELGDLKPFVLFVGRPEPRKGLAVIVEAMQMVRKRLELHLVAVGPTSNDVPPWVRALGPVEQNRLPGIYRAADLFCAPSLGGESFGIVLAEAMAAGTPVVCSDIPGYLEAAAGAALHVRAGDSAATAEQIVDVFLNPGRLKDLVETGKQRARQLDWGLLVDQILERYRAAQERRVTG